MALLQFKPVGVLLCDLTKTFWTHTSRGSLSLKGILKIISVFLLRDHGRQESILRRWDAGLPDPDWGSSAPLGLAPAIGSRAPSLGSDSLAQRLHPMQRKAHCTVREEAGQRRVLARDRVPPPAGGAVLGRDVTRLR